MAQAEAQPTRRPGAVARWLHEHRRVFVLTIAQLGGRIGSTLLTAAVIGLTLALPAVLQVAGDNLARAGERWQGAPQAALFLKDEVDASRGQELARELGTQAGVSAARYISREDALADFKQHSGLDSALDELDSNPLPATILLTPDETRPRAEIDALFESWSRLPEVELARFDQVWLERLQAALDVLRRIGVMLAALLVTAAVATVGNTVRLDLEARREEIRVSKLLGASNAFVRRPFLYLGLWYGLVGSLVALLLIQVAITWLAQPVEHLAGLYESAFRLQGPSWRLLSTLVGAGVLLGIASAAWSASRGLSRIVLR